jgi:hypothetical protein
MVITLRFSDCAILKKLLGSDPLDLHRSFLHKDTVPTVRAPYTAVFVVDLNRLLASNRCTRKIRAACEGVPAFFALPDSSADAAHRWKPALCARMRIVHLLFDISDTLSDVPAVPHTESAC